ncbi:D-amino-acid transaminase [Segnochrobactraceae bacterium EtOH-i3]
MSRIAYVNGRYLPHRAASVSIDDRGYQFADGIYEVCEVAGGCLIDPTRHLDRLDRSLAELRIAAPMGRAGFLLLMREIARRNHVRDGLVYLQVSRGVAPRDHGFPVPPVKPALVATAHAIDPAVGEARAARGVAVISLPDERWARVDIKTTSLTGNVLAKQAARDAGAHEAFLVDRDGFVTEGASTNVWIVTADGALVTRPAERGILRGITRTTLMDVAAGLQIRVIERPFTIAEAQGAAEAFLSSATQHAMPVVSIDGVAVGDGRPGPVARRLRATFREFAEQVAV